MGTVLHATPSLWSTQVVSASFDSLLTFQAYLASSKVAPPLPHLILLPRNVFVSLHYADATVGW